MGRLFLGTLLALCMPGLAAAQSSIDVPLDTSSPTMPMPLNLADRSEVPDSTADHTLFEILHRDFQSGPEVTEACLSCHTSADEQVMHSVHFQWDYTHPETGQELGKSNVINAFCGNVVGNEPRCTSCHAGYGWTDMNQTPEEQGVTVDCLVCHDNTGEYDRLATGAGHPALDPVPDGARNITGALATPVNLSEVAQNVGMPTRENCGNCHFYGGGGDNVKHGDLSSVLYDPPLEVDVHMSADGANFQCSTCHVEENHSWAGSRYNVEAHDMTGTGLPGEHRFSASCQSCHGTDPHPTSVIGVKLNDHTDTVACQTCHIPEFARGGVATKTWWDWSTAGRTNEQGNPISESNFVQSNGDHLHTYMTIKGDFEWEENVVPEYAWFNGIVEYTLQDEVIDPTQVVGINRIQGSAEDGESLIWPFKLMEGRQAYDAGYNQLVFSHVWGPTTDTAFWTNFQWDRAIEAGMAAADVPYSGEYGFVDTHMYWPITHMVAPSEDALNCADCHAEDGRLENIAGVYMPGTDPNGLVGLLGKLLVLATIGGLLVHAGLRVFTGKKGGASHD